MNPTNKHLLSRRQFGARCAALALSVPAIRAARGQVGRRAVRFPDGRTVPALGQGSWHLGQDRHPPAVEAEAIRTGIALGMPLIDTSGNYGNGRSERFIGRAIAGQRDQVFLVSKVEADEISGEGIARACSSSLSRLDTDAIDLYLLHSPAPSTELSGVVAAFERLRGAGKIRAWGVSNFNVSEMEDLLGVPDGHRCATNQVPYSLTDRRIEHGLLPWCTQHHMPVMAYSPLGGDGSRLIRDPTLVRIGAQHDCSAAAVALAWVMRSGNVIAIPESGSPAHTRENAAALSITLTPGDLEVLDSAFPV